jgi:hypothetical protein
MVSYLKNSLWYTTDKLGDFTIYALDEFKFWGEVLVDFMEMDKSSSDHYMDDYRSEVRQQIEESNEYQKEVEVLLKNEEAT